MYISYIILTYALDLVIVLCANQSLRVSGIVDIFLLDHINPFTDAF
jgi:hypothetical protein